MRAGHRDSVGNFVPSLYGGVLHTHFTDPTYTEQREGENIQEARVAINLLGDDHFGADPSVIGKQIKPSNTPATVIGIAPPDFRGVWPGGDIDMYLPFQFLNVIARTDIVNTPTSFFSCSAIGRLKPGVTIQQAQTEISGSSEEFVGRFRLGQLAK